MTTATRTAFERGRIEAKTTIEEDDEFYVVKDNVLVKTGVFNRWRRDAPVLEKVWKLYEGIPITHPHPEGLVEDLALVAGIVRNVRYDEKAQHVVADYALAKHEKVPGLIVRPEIVKLNAETVRRVQAGEHVENSQGTIFQFTEESGELDGKPYDITMTELVPNHLAILLDQDGACSWEDGCGLARLALERARRAAESTSDDQRDEAERRARGARREAEEGEAQGSPAPAGRVDAEDTHMCDKDCTGNCATAKELKTKLETSTSELQAARSALEKLRSHKNTSGAEAAKSDAGLAHVVLERLDKLERYEAAEAKAHETLAKDTARLAIELKKDVGKEEDLVSHYKTWPAAALLEHKSALGALKARNEGGKRRDTLRAGTNEAADGSERRSTVGIWNGKEWA